jgi:hypothetical protein
MSISRYIVVAVVRLLLRLLALAGPPEELADAEVAVGDEWAHAARQTPHVAARRTRNIVTDPTCTCDTRSSIVEPGRSATGANTLRHPD